jgi:hypothetical protein
MAKEPLKLYTHPDFPEQWIGEDKHHALLRFPKEAGGWVNRTAFDGDRRRLVKATPSEARGTRWPGAGSGRKTLEGGASVENRTIRTNKTDGKAWDDARGDVPFSIWARDALNEKARRINAAKADASR